MEGRKPGGRPARLVAVVEVAVLADGSGLVTVPEGAGAAVLVRRTS